MLKVGCALHSVFEWSKQINERKKWNNTYSEDKDFTSWSMLYTGCKRVRKVSLPAETVRHIWLPPRLSAISCFLPRLRKMASYRKLFPKHNSLGRKQEIADSLEGSQIWRTVSAGSENWRTRLYPVLYSLQNYLNFVTSSKLDRNIFLFSLIMLIFLRGKINLLFIWRCC